MTNYMRRREFITLLGGAAAAWPLAARAQQAVRVRRIGVLMGVANDAVAQGYYTPFLQELQKLGWTAGRNIRIEERWGNGNIDLIPPMQRSRRAWDPMRSWPMAFGH
jgi:putative ABC transport system substrate-binding protein